MMSAAEKTSQIPIDEYLAGELVSSIKHEYLGGYVYAMAGAKNAHNIIATNVVGSLYAQLRGKRCRPFNSDTKIRVKLPTHVRFYYPDASVVCDQNPADDSFQDRPVVIIEVVSEKTRRVDFGEKKDAYLTIPTLQVLVLLEQSRAAATVFRRTEQGFAEESHATRDAIIPLAEVEAELPLADAFEAVEFVPDADEEDL